MEQYTIRNTNTLSVKQSKYFNLIHEKHIASYGEESANNIVTNVLGTYVKIMQQLHDSTHQNHNTLLVGKVQSGKTSNLELLTALAFDNGYNFLLFFGGYDKELLKQTTQRFGGSFDIVGSDIVDSEQPALFTTNTVTNESVPLSSLDVEFAQRLLSEKRPIIVTCLKRKDAMQKALKVINEIQLANIGLVPFIIDDEGDQASLNTAKDKTRNSTPTYKTIVNIKRTLNNPLYLSVTATPQANIFQADISELNPASIHTMQPGHGYNGASIYHLSDNTIIEEVSEDNTTFEKMLDMLPEVIDYFLVVSAIKRMRASVKKEYKSDMIIHMDRTQALHGLIFSRVEEVINNVKDAFLNNDSVEFYYTKLKKAYDKYLQHSLQSQYPFDDVLIENIKEVVLSTGIILQNANGKRTKDTTWTKYHKIFIGGDLLQRGLTFPNLLVTLFTRFAKSGGNMDTTLQRARWFGYRGKYLDLCKIFTTTEIAKEFTVLAEVEDDLWEQFEDVEKGLLNISDIIIQAENTKQNPTAKNKAKFKKVSFKNRWIKQKFIVLDNREILENNNRIEELLNTISTWIPTTAGSTINAQTATYAMFTADQLISLIQSVNTAFDREPFNKKPLIDLVGSSDIPVIQMWTNEDDKTRYRSVYDDNARDRIKALHQGANTTNIEQLTYLGDKKVVIDPNKVNIQIHRISPGLRKSERLGKDQYMFAIYIPKDKIYFIKDND